MDLWISVVWIGLMVVFLLAEAACPLHLVSVWFAAGALVALIVSWLGGALWLQVTLSFWCPEGRRSVFGPW